MILKYLEYLTVEHSHTQIIFWLKHEITVTFTAYPIWRLIGCFYWDFRNFVRKSEVDYVRGKNNELI